MRKINEQELHELFNGIKNKDENSFAQLYEKYYNLVYGIVFSILKNKEDSEDVTQIIFSRIYELPKEKLPENYEASWLYKVSKNETLQYIRKAKSEITLEDIYDVYDTTNNIDEIIDTETYKKMISGLNDKEKEIVSLKILSQFTFKKIGQMLKMPTGTVQWNYYKAVNSLKISLSSLAGFIITFILGVATTNKQTNKTIKEEKADNIIKENNKFETDRLENKFEVSSSEDNQKSEGEGIISSIDSDITSSTVQNVSNVTKDSYINIGFFGISLIFFLLFIIFFTKYQQKCKIKTSKC